MAYLLQFDTKSGKKTACPPVLKLKFAKVLNDDSLKQKTSMSVDWAINASASSFCLVVWSIRPNFSVLFMKYSGVNEEVNWIMWLFGVSESMSAAISTALRRQLEPEKPLIFFFWISGLSWWVSCAIRGSIWASVRSLRVFEWLLKASFRRFFRFFVFFVNMPDGMISRVSSTTAMSRA